MSDHTSVFVPLESWSYNSPELCANNKSIDIGLLAEALIYYEQIIINVGNQPQFAKLLEWFIQQNKYNDFLGLVKNNVIKIYEYAFISAAVQKEGTYILCNIQDEKQAEPNTFEERYLYHQDIQNCFKHARQRSALYKALRDNVIEVKASEFASAIENAKKDYENPYRDALIIQAFVDELYEFRKLGKPPDINATVTTLPDERKTITWNINFEQLSNIAGKELNFHKGTPLSAGAVCNRLIWSAAQLKCDLYIGQPMSTLIGDKLYESSRGIDKSHTIIQELKERVEFPDIRQLANKGSIGLDDVLKIRGKAQKFRNWLQEESDRDRDAIIAYHHEVANESGIIKTGRKVLNMFGVIGGAAIGAALGDPASGLKSIAIGGMVGGATSYICDIASKLGADWKPVVFGNWAKERIEKVLKDETKNKD